jgi:hypothetical protein
LNLLFIAIIVIYHSDNRAFARSACGLTYGLIDPISVRLLARRLYIYIRAESHFSCGSA